MTLVWTCSGCDNAQPDSKNRCTFCGGKCEQVDAGKAAIPAWRPSAPTTAVSVRPPEPTDWRTLAVKELRDLIAQVAAGETAIATAKAKAEQTYRALQAADVKDLDALPWKATARAIALANAGKAWHAPCAICGATLRSGMAKKRDSDRAFICKGGCPEVAA